MARTRVRFGRLALTILLSALAATVAGRAAAGTQAPRPAERVEVRAGDTLWTIARARVGEAGDPRPVIQAIMDLNELSGPELLAGQTLLMP